MGGDSITPFLSTQTCSFYEPPLDLGRLPTRRQCVWDVHIAGLRYLHGRLFVHFQFAGAGFYTPVPLRLKNTWVHRGVAHTVWEWLYCEFSCLKGQISHGCDKKHTERVLCDRPPWKAVWEFQPWSAFRPRTMTQQPHHDSSNNSIIQTNSFCFDSENANTLDFLHCSHHVLL